MTLDFRWESYFTPNFTPGFSATQDWYDPWELAYLNIAASGGGDTVPQIWQYIPGQRYADGLRAPIAYAEVTKTLRFGSTAQIILDTCSDRDMFEISDNEGSGHMLPRMKFPYRVHRINVQAKADGSMPTNMFVGSLIDASIQQMSDVKNNQDGRWRIELGFFSFDHPRGLLGRNRGAPLWHHRLNTTTDNYHLSFRSADALTFDSAITQVVAWMNTSRPPLDFPVTFSYSEKATSPYNLTLGSKPVALTGTVTFTNGSAAVSGSGTAFDTELQAGQKIRLDADATWVYVSAITSATALTLTANYSATGGAGASSKIPISDVVTVDGQSTWEVLEKLLGFMGAVEGSGNKYIPTCSATGVIDTTHGGFDKTAAAYTDFRSQQLMNKDTSTAVAFDFPIIDVEYTGVNDAEYWIKFTLYKWNGSGWDTVLNIPTSGYEYVPYDPNNTHARRYYKFPLQTAGTYKWDTDLVTTGSFGVVASDGGGYALSAANYQFLNSPLQIDYSKVNSFLITRGSCYDGYGGYASAVAAGKSPQGCKDGGLTADGGNQKCTDSGAWGGCYPDPIAPSTALTGTVTMTNGNTAVTGVGTTFTTELVKGNRIKLDADSSWGIVRKINSNTSVTLVSVYGGTGGSGAASKREGVNLAFGVQGAYAKVNTLSNLNSHDTVCRVHSKKLYTCQLNTESQIREPLNGTLIFNDGYTEDLVGRYVDIYSPEVDDMVRMRVTEQKHMMAGGRLTTVMKVFRV